MYCVISSAIQKEPGTRGAPGDGNVRVPPRAHERYTRTHEQHGCTHAAACAPASPVLQRQPPCRCGSADEVCLSSSRATRQPRRTCAGARHWQTLRLSPGGRRCATRHSHARSPAHRLAVSGTHCTESQHAARRAAHKPCRLRSSPFEPM